jgi:hypothetical protein
VTLFLGLHIANQKKAFITLRGKGLLFGLPKFFKFSICVPPVAVFGDLADSLFGVVGVSDNVVGAEPKSEFGSPAASASAKESMWECLVSDVIVTVKSSTIKIAKKSQRLSEWNGNHSLGDRRELGEEAGSRKGGSGTAHTDGLEIFD